MNTRPIVHIVDDDLGVRTSMRALVEVVQLDSRVYASAEDYLDRLEPLQHGCLATDLQMPGMSGIELLRHLRGKKIDIPAIIISGSADVPAMIQIMKLGAIDMLEKPVDHTAFILAVRTAIEKSDELISRRTEIERMQAVFADLTPRERELLRLIVRGRSNKQIAIDLKIAIKTVSNHRASLMAKTHALNAADLARMATIEGLFAPE
jgi:two-component system response regulator FixJ